ncbi:hypothetical protein IE53DRAFT_380977 [Violaceomyces palustris]|uniref:Uncharacterized protein n=1 Tax=Violaceomyces palustris TaxID=1673888 RepID=A0ACD0NSS1_9BASI|nr:hypothetical protein IE53DRAFT_380977 [Violaceomyces palustris]
MEEVATWLSRLHSPTSTSQDRLHTLKSIESRLAKVLGATEDSRGEPKVGQKSASSTTHTRIKNRGHDILHQVQSFSFWSLQEVAGHNLAENLLSNLSRLHLSLHQHQQILQNQRFERQQDALVVETERLQEIHSLSIEACACLDLLQGLSLSHKHSRSICQRRGWLELILAMTLADYNLTLLPRTLRELNERNNLDPSHSQQQTSPSIFALSTLMCFLADSEKAMHMFDEIGGPARVSELSNKCGEIISSGLIKDDHRLGPATRGERASGLEQEGGECILKVVKEIDLACLEFRYFYGLLCKNGGGLRLDVILDAKASGSLAEVDRNVDDEEGGGGGDDKFDTAKTLLDGMMDIGGFSLNGGGIRGAAARFDDDSVRSKSKNLFFPHRSVEEEEDHFTKEASSTGKEEDAEDRSGREGVEVDYDSDCHTVVDDQGETTPRRRVKNQLGLSRGDGVRWDSERDGNLEITPRCKRAVLHDSPARLVDGSGPGRDGEKEKEEGVAPRLHQRTSRSDLARRCATSQDPVNDSKEGLAIQQDDPWIRKPLRSLRQARSIAALREETARALSGSSLGNVRSVVADRVHGHRYTDSPGRRRRAELGIDKARGRNGVDPGDAVSKAVSKDGKENLESTSPSPSSSPCVIPPLSLPKGNGIRRQRGNGPGIATRLEERETGRRRQVKGHDDLVHGSRQVTNQGRGRPERGRGTIWNPTSSHQGEARGGESQDEWIHTRATDTTGKRESMSTSSSSLFGTIQNGIPKMPPSPAVRRAQAARARSLSPQKPVLLRK